MTLYIIKSIACAFFFLALYFWLLEKDKLLNFKRFFLIGSLVLSFIIPLIELPQSTNDPLAQISELTHSYINVDQEEFLPVSQTVSVEFSHTVQPVADSPYTIANFLFGLYAIVTTVLLMRFLYNLLRLYKMAATAETIKRDGYKIILYDKQHISFSFFNYIFISKQDYNSKYIANEILIHELVHARQKHSADVLFVELLIAFFWFNPALYLYRRAVKLNHEYLADQGVIDSTSDVANYQMILIERASNPNTISLTSNLNYLVTKKRLIMMTKKTSKKSLFGKLLILAPAFALSMIIFSSRMLAEESITAPSTNITEGMLSGENGNTTIVPKSGVAQDKIDQYKSIVSRYASDQGNGKITWKSEGISQEDIDVLYPIYVQMTKEQREKQFLHFLSPLTSPMLRSPNVDEWKNVTSSKNDQIWLDGKLTDSKAMASYNRNDICYFLFRRKTKDNILRSDLWTKKGYDAYIAQYGKQITVAQLFEIPPLLLYRTGYDTGN